MIAMIVEAIEATTVMTDEIITIDEMIVETAVEEEVEIITIVMMIDVIVEVTKGETEDQMIAVTTVMTDEIITIDEMIVETTVKEEVE